MNATMYSAAKSIRSAELEHEVIASNLANARTPGYKSQRMVFSLPDTSATTPTEEGRGFAGAQVSTDFSSGDLVPTENPLDLALARDGFFTVETPTGERYTRNGSFTLDADGRLITRNGNPVLGQAGPVTVDPAGTPPHVVSDGSVYQGKDRVGQLRITTFPNPGDLVQQSDGLFSARVGQPLDIAADPLVKQGFQERANVDLIRELVGLITIQRRLEANQRILRSVDRTLDRVINQR